jgi:hypothetical protein
MLEGRVGTHQRGGLAGASAVDCDDTELLAQPLENWLKGGQSVNNGVDEDDCRLAAPVLVKGEPRRVPLSTYRTR